MVTGPSPRPFIAASPLARNRRPQSVTRSHFAIVSISGTHSSLVRPIDTSLHRIDEWQYQAIQGHFVK